MADYNQDEIDENTPDDEVVARAKRLASAAYQGWSTIYEKARADLRFLSDEDGAQWDGDAFSARISNSRPALTVDQLMQFVNQVANNVRMNTPSINVIPADQSATKEVAEILKGRIKDIEHLSNADDAYDTAVLSAIKSSIGYIRVDHRYRNSADFEQEIFIDRVVNPFAILLDPCSIAPDGSDAMYAFVIDEIKKSQFERDFPGKDCVSFELDGDDGDRSKDADKLVKIAEFFEVKIDKKRIGLLPDGTVEEAVDGGQYIRTRELERRTVKRYKLSGKDLLEETEFPGKYIPIVPVYGEEAWIGGERHLNSLIRRAKDAQRMFNYWKTAEAEMLMRAPKAIAIAPVGTTEDFADDWKYPEKATVLRYTPKTMPDGTPAPPPQLNNPPPIPAGLVNAALAAQQDIKSTMGLYNAFIGQTSNETSGVAIQARKVEGDRAVYHFGDNLVRSIAQVGKIIVSMLTVIDDTPKMVRVVGEDGNTKLVGINGAITEGQDQSYMIADGEYSVRVTTGNSLPTMRQEFASVMQGLMQANPELLMTIGDIFFRNQDFPGAIALAERIEKMLPPQLRDDDENRSPEVVALTQENEQLKGAMVQMQAELQSKQAELQIKQQEIASKVESDQNDASIELAKLRLDEQRLLAEIEIKRQEMALKARELSIKEAEAVASLNQMAGVVAVPQMGETPQNQGEQG